MERPVHAGLRHLALNARNLDAMKRFYVELLGFAVEWEPDSDNVYLSSGADNLALHRSPQAQEALPGQESPEHVRQVLDHLGILVREADDVDRWAVFLEERGVVLTARPRTHRDGARSCYFKDPDGNSVQILHHPPISGT
jgi:catechol 2,3-dioxygenase-like lactoylglutathione lyase family enzyme